MFLEALQVILRQVGWKLEFQTTALSNFISHCFSQDVVQSFPATCSHSTAVLFSSPFLHSVHQHRPLIICEAYFVAKANTEIFISEFFLGSGVQKPGFSCIITCVTLDKLLPLSEPPLSHPRANTLIIIQMLQRCQKDKQENVYKSFCGVLAPSRSASTGNDTTAIEFYHLLLLSGSKELEQKTLKQNSKSKNKTTKAKTNEELEPLKKTLKTLIFLQLL